MYTQFVNKNFDDWNEVKKKVERNKRIEIREGSVWMCSFGLNIGYEINGKHEQYERPALIIKSFGIGGGIVLPLTSKDKKGKYVVPLNDISNINLTQIRYLDSKRFRRFLFEIKNAYLNEIKNKFKDIL
jgi:mRNA interferase MazF